MNVQLLVIDPQNDFCDPNGSLYVQGAEHDMERLANMINRLSNKIDDIHVTLDSHQMLSIFSQYWWVNSKNEHPTPFTIITSDDVKNGVWNTFNPSLYNWSLNYIEKLEQDNRYPLCIWPDHCIIGTNGASIYPCVSDALNKWAIDNYALVNYVTKGSNPKTEHYSGLKAEVEDPGDPTTQINMNLIQVLQEADKILICGEASSHCVCNTIYDICNVIGDEHINKFIVLKDAMSPVTGFENLETEFFNKMKSLGVEINTTDKVFV